MGNTEKRIKADDILINKDFTNEQKLFLISQLYKEELNNMFPQLNYALLGWKDAHLKEIWSKEVIDFLEEIKEKSL